MLRNTSIVFLTLQIRNKKLLFSSSFNISRPATMVSGLSKSVLRNCQDKSLNHISDNDEDFIKHFKIFLSRKKYRKARAGKLWDLLRKAKGGSPDKTAILKMMEDGVYCFGLRSTEFKTMNVNYSALFEKANRDLADVLDAFNGEIALQLRTYDGWRLVFPFCQSCYPRVMNFCAFVKKEVTVHF
jgi:hypothetical protein